MDKKKPDRTDLPDSTQGTSDDAEATQETKTGPEMQDGQSADLGQENDDSLLKPDTPNGERDE